MWLKTAKNGFTTISELVYIYVKLIQMLLKLTNNLTKAEMEFQVTDKNTSGMFYVFDIQLESKADEGEYTYELFDDDSKKVATGLLQIGDYVAEHQTYNNDEKTYIVYGG